MLDVWKKMEIKLRAEFQWSLASELICTWENENRKKSTAQVMIGDKLKSIEVDYISC